MGRLFAKDLQLSDERRDLLRAMLEERGLAGALAMPRRSQAGPAPLSFAQERLWFLHQLDPGSAAYNVAVKVRLHGRLEVPVLRQALTELVRRHEALRTTIEIEPDTGVPTQRAQPASQVPLEVVDISAMPDGEGERLAYEQAALSFDLSRGPLMRTNLLRHGPDRHTLVVTIHHIVVDAWSIGVTVTELARLYEDLRRGRTSTLPEPSYQYADYAVWQRDWLRGDRLERQLSYWRERLAGLRVLSLPTDHPRPPAISSAGAQFAFQYPAALQDSLSALCRREGVTMFMTLLAAFNVLMSRYSGQRDIAVGTPIAGRGRPELENLIGFFINTLVLRTDLGGGPSFREVLTRVRETSLGAFEHQDLPFERLVEELQPQRSLDRTPLFQVMFGLQNTPVNPIELEGLDVAAESVDTASSMFDLLVTFDERPDGLAGLVTYRTDLFVDDTIARLAAHLRQVLEAVATDPGVRVDAIELLTPHERLRMLALAAGASRPRPPVCLPELFEDQVARTPGAVAVSALGRDLTYAELNRLANRLARELAAHGVGPDTRVGIAIERSLELVVALIATGKAGGCCVPLDLSYPTDRLAWIIADAGVSALLVGGAAADSRPAFADGVPVIDVCADLDCLEERDDVNVGRRALPETLGYVIYTSGSTGRPKGVMVRHAALVNHMLWMQERFPLDPTDRVLQKTSVGFDASIWEFWVPLLAGARVVMARPGGERDNGYLVRVLRDEEVTTLQLVPGLLDVLLETAGFAQCGRLRRVFCGGEALPADLGARFHATVPAELVNLYGPAETCVDAVTHVSGPADGGPTVPIGTPITNMRAYVLDGRMNLVPFGVVGELYLGGAGLGRGYLGRPDLTAEVFVPDPFADSTEPGGRLYRTGDLVRRRPGGALEYVGRRDRQLKLRGHRIEPTEIEQALGTHPAVRHLVVEPVADPTGVRLVAYVVVHPAHTLTLAELRAHATAVLPAAMHPAALVLLPQLPRSRNGKLDRAALPVPAAETPAPRRPPRTPLERLLCDQYATILGHRQVDPESSFFDLGGNSLQAMRLIARLRASLGESIPVSLLFQAPTPASLAAQMQGRRAAAWPQAAWPQELPPHIPRAGYGPGRPGPLSSAQRRLWFLQRLHPNRCDYNVSLGARLSGALDVAAFRRALSALAARHDVLRTRFESTGATVHAVVAEPGEVPLEIDDPADPLAAALAVIQQPFDLSSEPAWRVRLLRTGPREHLLVVAVHHIATDGWSTGVLMRDLAQFYTAERRGVRPSLRALPVTYADYAAWQRSWLAGSGAAQQLAYWRRQLAGARPARIGRMAAVPDAADRAGASLPLEIPPALRGRLAAAGREAGATLFMTLLATFNVLLYQETGQPDLAVGTDVANRPLAELEDVVGPFINQVVLRTSLADLPTFRDLLARTRQACEEAQAHQDVPFEDVVAAVRPARGRLGDPLVDVKIIFDEAVPPATLDDLVVEDVDLPAYTVKHDLDLFLRDDGARVTGTLHYATDALDPADAVALRDHFLALLESCAAGPGSRVHELPTRSERDPEMRDDQRGGVHPPQFRSVRPTPVRIDGSRLVTAAPFVAGSNLPLCVRPDLDEVDLADWATANREWMEERLVDAGAILFRGFGIATPDGFERAAQAICTQLYEENGEHTPVASGSRVQVPVFYPPDRELLWHNENSFNDGWPAKIMFCCEVPPERGGETTLADSRRVYEALDPSLRAPFEQRGVRYQRNFGEGIGLGWEQVYQTTERTVVEEQCRAAGIRCVWLPGNRLRTVAVRPATIRHPRSGAQSWFNQAQHWHIACLDPRTRESLLAMFDEPDLPRSCSYGDGGRIESSVMDEIVGVYRSLELTIPWQKGDLLLVDNVLTAHGRKPFAGTRRVLVALGDEVRYDELAPS